MIPVADDRIPNNVSLSHDRKLQRALERWQPKYLDWWREMGPAQYQDKDIYLRTAVGVEAGGWAHYDYVKMPEYRWGIFISPLAADRTIHFGDHIGARTWDDVPGEFRRDLRRLIVTQADTEPASVEQQRMLAATAPSLYDMRNLFQVNVEEGRHLWAMVYLLMRFFARDGREEAEELLIRRAGNADSPRILYAFNEPIRDWLDFFCFATFTDRDGKYQLGALAESAFNPLAGTTQFMLTEEGHHLFVGETGVGRTMRRSAELMREASNGDVTKSGGIPLELIQKYINHWFSVSIDLFGSEDSTNAANYFAAGLKGRFNESSDKVWPDHKALDKSYTYETLDENGEVKPVTVPLRRAMNAVLKDSYITDCERFVGRWNKIMEEEKCEFRFRLPSLRFNRSVGVFAGRHYDPDGKPLSSGQWEQHKRDFLPTTEDRDYINELMVQVIERGTFANWISPPAKGINRQPIDFEYVKIH
ncbi:MAG: benzoyl-CoA 2,3-epoxidase subunit BoxB [Anaerolineales bacterium]|jgi:benzoyl-CoA 2,3-dioxygenase component B